MSIILLKELIRTSAEGASDFRQRSVCTSRVDVLLSFRCTTKFSTGLCKLEVRWRSLGQVVCLSESFNHKGISSFGFFV